MIPTLTNNTGGTTDGTLTDGFTQGAALTDNATGTAGTTLAAGVGQYVLSIPVDLASLTAAGDVLTNHTLGHPFKILDVDFVVTKPVTTASKAATLNLEIGITDLTGGAVALTSANCAALGAGVAGSAITGNNTGSATDTLSIEASAVTAFTEGAGVLLIRVQNMDTADALASLAARANELRMDVSVQNDNAAELVVKLNKVIALFGTLS